MRTIAGSDSLDPVAEAAHELAIVMRVAGGEIEMAVRADGAGRAGGNAQLAFKTRIKVERLGVGRDLGRDDHRSEQDEAAEARMNHIAMDAHLPEAGSHRDRLVRNDPKPAGVPAIGLHRKSGGAAVDRADAVCVERPDDPPRDIVHLVGRVVKFEIGDRIGVRIFSRFIPHTMLISALPAGNSVRTSLLWAARSG